MSILRDVLKELWKMFVADLRLTLATLICVAVVALTLWSGLISGAAAAAILVACSVVVLAETVLREARLRHR